jgi:sterol desaturase/sphingolipid hydroxylase (fatty acid hydroxylase superfamily)
VSGLAYFAGKGLVGKLAAFALALWVYDNFRLFDLDVTSPWVWLAMFVLRDFVYYWIHRAEHRFAGLWASHMVHHSPTQMNFATAVRMPWMEALYKPLLGLWAPLLGFHPAAFAAIGALVLLVGQYHHTEGGRRVQFLRAVFVTPATHRVHHGSNQRYLDKNFGSMLVIWDRLFGTYEAETEPVVYGLTGGKAIDRPAAALVGGYPDLFSRMRGAHSLRGAAAALVARPA